MTALGKILVFVNLMFSLLTVGLITMVFIARTNWRAGFDNVTAQLTKARDDLGTERESKQLVLDELKRRDTVARKESERFEGEIKGLKDQFAAEQTQRRTAEGERDAAKAINETTKEENRRLVAEQQNLQGQLTKRDAEIVNLKRDILAFRDDAVKFRLAYESARARSETLLAQLTDAMRQVRTMQASGAAGGAGRPSVLGGPTLPPVEDVRGKVVQVDTANGLATVSVGSDHGVDKGTSLEIFRLAPDPQYLGTLEIISATPKQAVGRFKLVSTRTPLRVGDEVASRLSVSR
jgi:hypothetical protein